MKMASNPEKSLALLLCTAMLGMLPAQVCALDFLQSYQAALAEDAEFRAAQAQVDADREIVPMALALLYPNVSSNASNYRNDLTTKNKSTSNDSVYPSSSFALTLRQPLYRPAQYAGYQQSKAKLQGIEANLDKARQDAALRVSNAYFTVLLAQESLLVVLSQKNAITTELNAASKALAAGTGTRTDIDDARARLDINQALEISARQYIEQARHQLSILINRPIEKIHLLRPDRLPLHSMEPDSLDHWLDRAESASPDINRLRSDVEAARLSLEQAKAGHLPTVDLIVQHSRSASDNPANPDLRYINNQVGVMASVPLFAGGYVSAQVRSAAASLLGSEERLLATRRKLTAEVRRLFHAVKEGVAKIKALEQAERSAEQVVLSSQKGFRAGTRTRLDILNAEQQRSQTRLDLAKERINFVLARLQLLALSGDLNEVEISRVNSWLAQDQWEPAVKVAVAPEVQAVAVLASSEPREGALSRQDAASPVAQEQAVRQAISAWAAAWARKDVASYLAAYAPDFKVPNGQSRAAWEQSRKNRILHRKQPIDIGLSQIRIDVNQQRATARFSQEYRSGALLNISEKVLVLSYSNGAWLIGEENSF